MQGFFHTQKTTFAPVLSDFYFLFQHVPWVLGGRGELLEDYTLQLNHIPKVLTSNPPPMDIGISKHHFEWRIYTFQSQQILSIYVQIYSHLYLCVCMWVFHTHIPIYNICFIHIIGTHKKFEANRLLAFFLHRGVWHGQGRRSEKIDPERWSKLLSEQCPVSKKNNLQNAG